MTDAERITPEWLREIGIYRSDCGAKNSGEPDELVTEFGCRIVGGTDDGWKTSSDQDQDGDEIADLVLVYEDDRETVSVYVETWRLPDLNTVALVELGSRRTRGEILALCRALRAWAIRYPE